MSVLRADTAHIVLDKLMLPLLVVATSGRIHLANTLARKWLTQVEAADKTGQLRRGSRHGLALVQLAHDACEHSPVVSCSIPYRRRATRPGGTHRLVAVPLAGGIAYGTSGALTYRTALVTVHQQAPASAAIPDAPGLPLLAGTYGLSPLESRVLGHLLAGRAEQQLSLQVAAPIAALQHAVQQIYAKTGTRNLVELLQLQTSVTLLAGTPPPATVVVPVARAATLSPPTAGITP